MLGGSVAAAAAVERQVKTLPRSGIAAASWRDFGAVIVVGSLAGAMELANRIAPEHLEISSNDPHRWEPLLKHAGAIFLGAFTSESLGDYCAGPNHVLPTSGTARFSSPLGVYDFQKRSSLIEVSEADERVPRSTVEAVRFGLYWGAVGAIRELIGKLVGEPSEADIFLTGGGAPALVARLGEKSATQFVPHLTLAGIALAARERTG